MTVVVDPYLLEIPTGVNVSPETVRQYAKSLVHWSNTFRINSDYVVSGHAVVKMAEYGLIPDTNNLSKLFQKYDIDEYSPNDIAVGCQIVMENFPQMEDRSNSMDITCQEEKRSIIPNEVKQRIHPEVADAFCAALIAASYAIHVLGEEDDWKIATAPLNGFTKITVSGEVEDKIVIPVEKIWPLLFDPEIFKEEITIQERILNIFEADPMEALRICWEDMRRREIGIPEITKYNIRFINRFVLSVIESANQKNTYEKDIIRIFVGVTNAITNRWNFGSDKHHALRESVLDRTTPQQVRKRGKQIDKAARIEVKAGKTPLHVHYWICYDESYEISNLTNDHDDATIYY